MKDAVDACTSVIEERHHTLTVVLSPSPVVVDVASARSVQVICNLLNNAAKYQKEDGRVELTASAESGAAVIRVRDDGVGIAPEMIDRIFDRFVQIDSSQHRDQGGLGIGLSLVRAVVELHGGSVQARSDGVGRGSEFIVTLPIAPPQPWAIRHRWLRCGTHFGGRCRGGDRERASMSSFDSLQLDSYGCFAYRPRVRARCVQFVTNIGCRAYGGSQMSGDGNRFAFLFQSRRRNRHADNRGDARLFVVAFDRRGVGVGCKPQRSRRRHDDVRGRGESGADGPIGEDRRRRSNGSGVPGRCAVSLHDQPRERFD